jgi:tetratricopeptide (TPR) repeat protein
MLVKHVRIGLVGLALSFVSPAQAQDDEAQEAASEHFARGVELYEEGSLGAAVVEFERAYEIAPDYRLLYNLSQVQAERREYVLASKLLERYLLDGGDDIPPERRAKAENEVERLGRSIAELCFGVTF